MAPACRIRHSLESGHGWDHAPARSRPERGCSSLDGGTRRSLLHPVSCTCVDVCLHFTAPRGTRAAIARRAVCAGRQSVLARMGRRSVGGRCPPPRQPFRRAVRMPGALQIRVRSRGQSPGKARWSLAPYGGSGCFSRGHYAFRGSRADAIQTGALSTTAAIAMKMGPNSPERSVA